MSKTVDQRVVEMQFDNKNFESNVQTSLSSLDKLKKSLDLQGASKGLEEINNAAKSNNVSALGSAAETVKMKFSALQVMGVTALANITNSAVEAGKKIVSSLSLDSITAGFQEYETQINAVQTILANTSSKGTTLDQVNSALDELNTYADKTIYNFTEMTKNIGTFTAAGVDLDTSVSAIQGIANLAAVSGSTSTQASTAMYQLSQALAAGKVSLQDWNSVVNAGMGGQVFQDALVRTSELLGTGAEKAIETYGSFRESLTQGEWLTTEVLTETLKQFAGAYSEADLINQGFTAEQAKSIAEMAQTATDAATKVKTFTQLIDTLKESLQSGWTQSWEIIIGDFEEAKELWTSISDTLGAMINESAQARNELLEGWAKGGGREIAIEALKNAFEGLISVIKPIKEAFSEVFPKTTSEQLINITKAVRDFTAKLKLSDEQASKVKDAFKKLFSIIKVGINIIKNALSLFVKLVGKLSTLGKYVLNLFVSLRNLITALKKSIGETDTFAKTVDKVVGFLQRVIDKVRELVDCLKEKISTGGFEGFLNVLKSIWDFLKKVGSKIGTLLSQIGESIIGAFRNGDAKAGLDVLNGGLFAAILIAVKKFVKNIKNITDDISGGLFGGISSGIKELFSGLSGVLGEFQKSVKAKTLKTIASAILMLAVALFILATIDPERLTSSIAAITALFADLMGSMKTFDKITSNSKGTTKAATTMVAMSVSVLILASALKKLSDLSWEEIGRGLAGVAGLSLIVVASAKIMSQNSKSMTKGAISLIAFALAIKILASVCKSLASLSWEEIAKGLVGVGALMLEVVAFLKLTDNNKMSVNSAVGIIALSTAIKILASACKDFSAMGWEEIAKGLVGVGALLLEVAAFTKLTGNTKNLISTGVGMIALGAAMKIFASAVKDFASMSWESLARGLVGMAGALAEVVIALKLMPKNLVSTGIGLIAVAASLKIMASALSDFGSMSWESIAKGLVALGGSMVILAVALNLMKGTLAGSAAMVIATVALAALVPILGALGSMSWESIIKGLVAIAGAFAIIGIAAAVLKPCVTTILALSAAMVIFGIACVAIGAGVVLFAAGIAALASALSVGASAIAVGIKVIVAELTSLVPLIAQKIGEGIVSICVAIGDGAVAICDAVKKIVLALIDVLVECIPPLVDGVLKLVSELLTSLVEYIPQIASSIFKIVLEVLNALIEYSPQVVDCVFKFLIAILESIASNLPALIQAVVDVIMALFKGVVDALNNVDPELLVQSILGIGMLSAMMAALAAAAAFTPAAMIGVLGIIAVLAEFGGLAQIPGLSWLIGEGADLLQNIGKAIGSFIGGFVGGIMSGISSGLPDIADNLSSFMEKIQPFLNGAKSINASTFDGVQSLIGIIIGLTAAEILDALTSWLTGGSSLESFAEQLVPFGESMVEFSKIVSGNVDESAVQAAANAGKIMAEMAATLPNSGGVAGFFAGENDMDDFGKQLESFGKSIVKFSSTVNGNIDKEAVQAAADAGAIMVKLADTVPNTGGVVSWFSGDNDLKTFGEQLVPFGEAMASFSSTISGNIDSEAIQAAADAGAIMVKLADTVPNTGGLVSWFVGDNDLETFAKQLIPFGEAMSEFSGTISGENKIDGAAVLAAANAGSIMAKLQESLPNTGGVFSLFTGEQNLATFGARIVPFGKAISDFSKTVSGENKIDGVAVLAAANAGSIMAKLQESLPNTGGVLDFFTGTQDLSNFGKQIAAFGDGIALFSKRVSGKINEDAVTAAANAGAALAEMNASLPQSGGVFSWFTGEQDLSKFSEQIVLFGGAIAAFSYVVTDRVNEKSVAAAASAGKALAEMSTSLPTTGGVFSWFTGEQDMEKFSEQLIPFGVAIAAFSDVVAYNVNQKAVTAAAAAGTAVAKMSTSLPTTGGIFSWFMGDQDMGKFGEQLKSFGDGIVAFSGAVKYKVNQKAVEAAAAAGTALTEMNAALPETGGVFSWFMGDQDMEGFASQLSGFGKAIVDFSATVKYKVNQKSVEAAASAGKALAEMNSALPESGGVFSWLTGEQDMDNFSDSLSGFGTGIAGFATALSGVSSTNLTTAVDNASELVAVAESIANVNSDSISSFSESVEKIGAGGVNGFISAISNAKARIKEAGENLVIWAKSGADGKKDSFKTIGEDGTTTFIKAISDAEDKFKGAGKDLISYLASGAENKKEAFKNKVANITSAGVSGANNYYQNFYNAGSNLGSGLVLGINDKLQDVYDAGYALGQEAVKGEKDGQQSNSPSKLTIKAGKWLGEGLVIGTEKMQKKVYKSGYSLGDTATSSISAAISKVASLMDSDMDTEPTIRPIVDLSDVTDGANAINSLFGVNPSIGVLSNLGLISTAMNARNQNSSNDDVISAINDLGRKLGSRSGDTYTINGVTYDDGSNITDAVKALVRAARIERRI